MNYEINRISNKILYSVFCILYCTAKFQKLATAYEVLSDDRKRANYDLTGMTAMHDKHITYPYLFLQNVLT